jgi:hypothetical protein
VKPDFTVEHFNNRMLVYRNRIIDELKVFNETGYPQQLMNAAYAYAVYRDLGLSFMLQFDDWKKLETEAKTKNE